MSILKYTAKYLIYVRVCFVLTRCLFAGICCCGGDVVMFITACTWCESRQDYKVLLIALIIFAAIIGVLMLGTDATQVETHQCDPGGTCPGCNVDISKPSTGTQPPYSSEAARYRDNLLIDKE